jgi:hypothetical protein
LSPVVMIIGNIAGSAAAITLVPMFLARCDELELVGAFDSGENPLCFVDAVLLDRDDYATDPATLDHRAHHALEHRHALRCR